MPLPLSRELAQRVIDQIAPTLEFNINVMDPSGRIIASTDPARIGDLHAVARAVASGEPRIVHDDGSPTERAGINLPVRLEGGIVGVLGITGPPERVAPVAQVLVLTMVLLLEREREMDDSARREAADRELLVRLVSGELAAEAIEKALAAGVPDLPPPWRLRAVLAPEPTGTPDTVESEPRPRGPHRHAHFGGALWVLTGGRGAGLEDWPAEIPPGCTVIDGGPCATGGDLAGSAQALGALATARKVLPTPPTSGALRLDDLAAELSVACLPPATAATLAARVGPLRAEHVGTLDAWAAAGGSVSATARVLFVHRNTLTQRLDRITQLTGLDPRIPAQAQTLRLATIASRAETSTPLGTPSTHG
ncbi:hypothetical protein GCM10009596_17760 [Arthrobacter rhombi]|uniref:CdaR family transcriptional regulator n=1 Tax=Arthrobacter rhombi TaxID=71253 RepID=UPI0031D9FF11